MCENFLQNLSEMISLVKGGVSTLMDLALGFALCSDKKRGAGAIVWIDLEGLCVLIAKSVAFFSNLSQDCSRCCTPTS